MTNNLNMQSDNKTSKAIVPMLLFFIVILAISIAVSYFGREKSDYFLLIFMSVLALVGLWAVFLYVGGWLKFSTGFAGNEPKSHGLMDDFPRAIAITDANLKITKFNPAFSKAFGITSETVNQLFNSDRSNGEKLYRLAQAGKNGNAHSETLVMNIGGAKKHYTASIQTNAEGLMWFFEDRTREILEQEQIFDNARRTFNLLDEAPAGFFACDEAGNITYINHTFASSLGRDLGEFASGQMSINDIMPKSFVPIFSQLLKHKVAQNILDGMIFLADKSEKQVTFHPKLIDDHGTPVIFTLVTDKRATSFTKTPSEKIQSWFQTFFDQSPLGLVIVDLKADMRRTNPAFIKLQTALDITSKSLLGLVEDANKAELAHAIRQAVQTGQTVSVDAPFKGDGKRWGKFYISPLENAEEEGEAAFVYVIDTSEQKSLQEQFAQSQKMQAVGQLAGGIAHDFNNVLQAIIGNSDLMLMNMRTTDVGFSEIREIKSNANRAASLVRQLLAFSRQQTFKVQNLQLNDVIHEMNALIKRSIADKMKLEMNYGRDVWLVKADLTQVEQVVLNLAVNARDAMPQGGSLTIKTANISAEDVLSLKRPEMPATDYVLLQVSDTGTGMPQAVIDKIFDPFFTTKDLGKGTGLGLSTVYGIIKQSGGFVYVDSIEGQGTTFRIYLPRFIDTAPAVVVEKIEPVKAPPAPDLTGNGTILYVEDEVAVRAFGVRALTSRGYTVIQAESGVEALELYEECDGKVDLVISDVVMPEMDGPTLLGELRKHNPNLKFIFASGYAEEAFAKNLPAGQEFHFMAKPFQMATLIKTVKDVMAS
jgi:two-component system, cell cycle sensor histidine kinase and response regulator CckA